MPDALSHVAQRHAIQSMFREQVLGRIEDLLQAFGALLCLAAALTLRSFMHRASPLSTAQIDRLASVNRCFLLPQFPICVVGTQLVLVNLARRGQRHGVDRHDLLGNPPVGDLAAQELEQRRWRRRTALAAARRSAPGARPTWRPARPMTAARPTAGCGPTISSISAGLIHSPPDLIRSLERPQIVRLPASSMLARSPVSK